jgi:hypothetical protein
MGQVASSPISYLSAHILSKPPVAPGTRIHTRGVPSVRWRQPGQITLEDDLTGVYIAASCDAHCVALHPASPRRCSLLARRPVVG